MAQATGICENDHIFILQACTKGPLVTEVDFEEMAVLSTLCLRPLREFPSSFFCKASRPSKT